MLFLNFQIQSDEETIRNRIYEIINGEVTSEGFWGQKNRESGICFKKNAKTVRGYFLEDAERNGGVKGNLPLRTVFFGRFIEKKYSKYFRGVVLPHPVEFLSCAALIVALVLIGSWFALLPAVLIAILFGTGYIKLLKETKSVLEVIFQ